jgi:hypothetical protein
MEALYLDCGARRPQLKRNPLGSITPMRSLIAVIAGGFTLQCSLSSDAASPQVAAVLDSLLPGIRIGARALPVANRLHLTYEPYVGYVDTSYQNGPGVHGLVLQITPDPQSEGQSPSRSARISVVGVRLANRASADAARRLLTRRLGEPNHQCSADQGRTRLDLYFWPDREPNWVFLGVPTDSAEAAVLMFGVQGPDSQTKPRPCDAA